MESGIDGNRGQENLDHVWSAQEEMQFLLAEEDIPVGEVQSFQEYL